jgi:hypothetical protein
VRYSASIQFDPDQSQEQRDRARRDLLYLLSREAAQPIEYILAHATIEQREIAGRHEYVATIDTSPAPELVVPEHFLRM